MISEQNFLNPELKYRMNTIVHAWPRDFRTLAKAIRAFGYGGTATNPEFCNGYTGNPENIRQFDRILRAVKEEGLSYWIYDEKGYPSGLGGGQSLGETPKNPEEEKAGIYASHKEEIRFPELEAKGFYMVRRIAYEKKHSRFFLDDESDKIIWAAKYPMDVTQMNTSRILYERMIPVKFTDDFCECDLEPGEAFFIFCVKPAYEGAHLTHNVSSRSRYINILDERAVKRFLEVGYQPIADALPDAYANADAVFTDEPSLQTPYMHGDEVWPYALAPWTEGLFEKFENMHGYDLKPYLPQIFEGQQNAYKTRVDFYTLIGELIAKSYVAQIRDWCHAHGTKFSGHYLAEEYVTFHALYYGSYLRVLRETDIQGVDVLAAHPGVYHYNTTRFAQMAARKKGRDGIMTELCPFMDLKVFEQNPVKNAVGILNLLYLGGCRKINSYFSSNFVDYAPEALADYKGFMSLEEANYVNNYAARMGVMLDGAKSKCRTAIYYPLEDVQAKTRPWHCARESKDCETDRSLIALTKAIYEQGEDYIIIDHEDCAQMVTGEARGCDGIENILIPTMDVIHQDAYEALVKLQESGKQIYFCSRVPLLRAEERLPFKPYDFREESLGLNDIITDGIFTAKSIGEICQSLKSVESGYMESGLMPKAEDEKKNEIPLIIGRYEREDHPLLFVVNNTLTDALVSLPAECTVYNPDDGSVKKLVSGEILQLKSYKGIFLLY